MEEMSIQGKIECENHTIEMVSTQNKIKYRNDAHRKLSIQSKDECENYTKGKWSTQNRIKCMYCAFKKLSIKIRLNVKITK